MKEHTPRKRKVRVLCRDQASLAGSRELIVRYSFGWAILMPGQAGHRSLASQLAQGVKAFNAPSCLPLTSLQINSSQQFIERLLERALAQSP
jgi:hypothetical protein